MQTIWLSPTDYVSGDTSLSIDYPSIHHSSTIVTSETIGDDKWILMSLRLPENISLEEIVLCYQVSNARSFICQVRIYELGLPEQGLVRCDEAVALQNTSPGRYKSILGGIIPTPGSALTL